MVVLEEGVKVDTRTPSKMQEAQVLLGMFVLESQG